MNLRRSAVLGVVCALVTLVAGALPAHAVSSGLVISQVYGGGGNSGATLTHDYVELYNRGPIALSLDGLSIQYASATGTGFFGASATQLTELPNVMVQPGQYFLVQQASQAAVGAALPTPDHIDPTPIAMAAGAGKVALVSGTTTLGCNGSTGQPCTPEALGRIIDLVGYGNANFFEGAAEPTLSATLAGFRAGNGSIDTDNNSLDFATGTPGPRNSNPGDAAPSVSSSTPTPGATGVARDANVSITFSEPVNVTGSWYAISCGTTGAHPATATGSSPTFTLDPTTNFAANETCTVRIHAANVTDQDATDPPDNMAANHEFTFQTADAAACGDSATKIPAIQGSGNAAAITGIVSVEGVVVGDYEGNAGLQGFYLQDPAGDGDASTSDGIFVFTGSADTVSAGQAVRVTGFARERFNQTALNGSNSNSSPVTLISVCGAGSVSPTDVSMPFAALDAPERYEGMLVRFPQPLVVSEYFNYERFGELVLALPLPGETRPFTPTSIVEPGAPALARAQANLLSRITLDDGLSTQNPVVLRHPDGNAFSLLNRFRGGDRVQNTVGVIGFDFSLYRI